MVHTKEEVIDYIWKCIDFYQDIELNGTLLSFDDIKSLETWGKDANELLSMVEDNLTSIKK